MLSGATKELELFVDLSGIPFFWTMTGKSAYDERHPLSLGAGCGTTTLPAHEWLKECDVVLALGSSLTRTPYGQGIRSDKIIIHNTIIISNIIRGELFMPWSARTTIFVCFSEIFIPYLQIYFG